MSDTPALTLQDLLNDIERNAYDGVSFTEEVDAAYTLAAEMGKTIDRLKDENAKLRELIHVLCYCMHDEDCDGCRLNGERGEIVADPLYACDGLHELLREQGIEVDE